MARILTFCILAFTTSLASAASLLVLNKEDATLSIFDVGTGQQRGANIPVGAGPHEVEISADQALAFVGNHGTVQAPGNSRSVIDLRTAKERTRVDLGDLHRPHGLAVQGQSVYLTAGELLAVDVRTQAVKSRLPLGRSVSGILVVPDGSRAYVAASGDGKVVVVAANAAMRQPTGDALRTGSGELPACGASATVTAATNLKPRPGIVTMYLCSPGRSPKARRMAAMLWLRLFSSTIIMVGQTALSSTSFATSSPGCSTKCSSVSKALETSGTTRPSDMKVSRRCPVSSRKSPNS
jgi:hypothetical protein